MVTFLVAHDCPGRYLGGYNCPPDKLRMVADGRLPGRPRGCNCSKRGRGFRMSARQFVRCAGLEHRIKESKAPLSSGSGARSSRNAPSRNSLIACSEATISTRPLPRICSSSCSEGQSSSANTPSLRRNVSAKRLVRSVEPRPHGSQPQPRATSPLSPAPPASIVCRQ